LEVYRLTDGRYQMVKADELERYRIAPLNLDLGVWQGDAKGTQSTKWLLAKVVG
jgi:hypothetical protein